MIEIILDQNVPNGDETRFFKSLNYLQFIFSIIQQFRLTFDPIWLPHWPTFEKYQEKNR